MSAIHSQNAIRPQSATWGHARNAAAALSDLGYPSSKFGIRLLSFYVFLLVSRVLDLSPIWWLHIPLMVLVLLVFSTLAHGGIKFALQSKISRYFGLFTLWVAVSYPFSQWRSESQGEVIGSVEFYLVLLIIVQTVRTPKDWRTVAGGYGYAVFVAAVYGFFFAKSVDGRLALVGGTFGDPNGFALSLLIGVPFLWVKAAYASVFKKLFFLGCSAVVFISFAKAGSRGGLLALAAMMLVMFIVSSASQRLMLCVVACLAIACAAAFLPGYLRARYFTIFSPASSSSSLDTSSKEQLESDIESSGERRALLIQSIQMTFEHPIFGVGPGVFAFAAWDERKTETGSGGLLLVTHNTYTQVSSETGLPGFFFFIATVFLSLKYVISDYRVLARARSDLVKLPRNLLLAVSALLVGIFFLSTAYSHFIAIFLALAAALHNIVQQQSAEQVPASAASITLPPPGGGALQGSKSVPSLPARRRVPSYLRGRGLAKTIADRTPPDRPGGGA